jgi:sarcosine oxidase / L-pipecolate oxidase
MSSSPESILIVGAGEFGLTTALSLLSRPSITSSLKKITIVDASPTLPNPSGSSVDASRIIRADYGNEMYARLAAEAQSLWREGMGVEDDVVGVGEGGGDGRKGGKKVKWGAGGRYHEPGFMLTADNDETAGYVKKSLGNVRELLKNGIEVLEGPEKIKEKSGHEGVSGVWGYVNWNSGWADAEKCVAFALGRVRREGGERVVLRSGAVVERLLLEGERCVGARLAGGEELRADLVVLAAGAWSPSLVDLQGRCVATAQVLTYTEISEAEEKGLRDNPTVMNLSRGMFIIPPRGGELKVARHGFGYRNLVKLSREQLLSGGKGEIVEVSVPRVGIQAPEEGQKACREALKDMMPSFGNRKFKNTRLCWYCDTEDGDFLITYHPQHKGLFIATGGSGHGFKFFPVLGEKIVDAIEGKLDPKWVHAWRWREETCPTLHACDDGSRAGPKEMILDEELAKGVKANL